MSYFRLSPWLAAGAALMFALPAVAQEWKFALEEIEGSVQDLWAKKFKEVVEEQTDATVTIYPYGTLGTSDQLTDLVANGALQLAFASPGHLGSLIPEIQVFSLHYLLSDDDEVNKQVLSESSTIYETLAPKFEDKDLRLLTMFPTGEMVWTTNKEIRSPEDFDNFKMRTMVSPMLVAAYEAVGASPTPLPYGEVYGGLQLGMIDGQVNPLYAIEEMKFYEVTDYMIFAGQQEFTTTVVTSPFWYDSLSEEEQSAVQAAVDAANDYIYTEVNNINEARLEAIKEAKPELTIITLSDEERAAFEEASMAAREVFKEEVEGGAEILDALVAEFEAAEAETN